MSKPKRYLDYHDVAERTGYPVNTIRVYAKRAKANRKAGTPKPGDLPEPDAYVGSREQYASPGWTEATIDQWMTTRDRGTD